ncbi:MAG: hypothetical protein KDA45_10795 [Planctomycetales bacterium]|nr:hypothetical protein [Planctomycetales bacterium]
MGQYGAMIADAASVGLRYATRLTTDIPATRFARLAAPAGRVVQANHPAFSLGHLCLYPVRVQQLLGFDTSDTRPPEGYEKLFSKEATCQDDPAGSIYPSSAELLPFFERSYQAALLALREVNDEQLLAANPVQTPLQSVCPTLGAILTFYVSGHVTTHLGQVSTWRRMEGMPPA